MEKITKNQLKQMIVCPTFLKSFAMKFGRQIKSFVMATPLTTDEQRNWQFLNGLFKFSRTPSYSLSFNPFLPILM